MAEEKKAKKPGLCAKIGKLLREFKSEFKKVVWPAFPQTVKNTVLVLVVLVISTVVIALLDLGFSKGLTALANLM